MNEPVMTISSVDHSVTLTSEALRRATQQLEFPFPLDQAKLADFLNRWLSIEAEEDRLREEKRLLKEDFLDDLPMRGLLVAVKIVRARAKLEAHAKEPMKRVHLEYLESLVEQHLRSTQQALDAMQAAVLDMQSGERRA